MFLSRPGEGQEMRPKEILDVILPHKTLYIVVCGGEPFDQSIRVLSAFLFYSRKWFRKRMIVETDGSRFNQILFLNTSQFIVQPCKETFNRVKLDRWIIHSNHKIYTKTRSPDFEQSRYCNTYATKKFVELRFSIHEPEDLNFAHQVFMKYDLCGTKFFIKNCMNEEDFAKIWQDKSKDFFSYKYFYFI